MVLVGPSGCGVKVGACGVTCGEGAGCDVGGGGCGGAGGGCGAGCGDGPLATSVVSYVGTGAGEYVAETSYKYVGKGAGDITFVEVPTAGGWCKWLLVIPMVLAIIWLAPGLSSETTTTTAGVPKSCQIYGDPHANTFDGQHTDLYTKGEFWMVKSKAVWIQGKYAPTQATNGLSVTKEIAVGGPFLNGHKLIVSETTATWDSTAILTTFPSTWSDPAGLVHIDYNAQGETLQQGREGKDFHVLHITMPEGVSIQVNRWDEPGEGKYINVKITMPPQPAQDGDCGNFNGIAIDDRRIAVRKRMGMGGVPAADLLFPTPKTIVDQAIENCEDEALTAAHEKCKAGSTSFWPKMTCLKSVCNGGPVTQ